MLSTTCLPATAVYGALDDCAAPFPASNAESTTVSMPVRRISFVVTNFILEGRIGSAALHVSFPSRCWFTASTWSEADGGRGAFELLPNFWFAVLYGKREGRIQSAERAMPT